MKILNSASYSIQSGEVTIVTSNKFDELALPSQLDILKAVINDLRAIYSDKLKEHRTLKPSKKKEIGARAREHAMLAYKFRQKGWTYKAVGVALYVSASRARQLVKKAERIIEREKRWNNESN